MATLIVSIVIGIASLYYAYEIIKLYNAFRLLNRASKNVEPLKILSGTRLLHLVSSYERTINLHVGETLKSNIPASEYFNSKKVSEIYNVNLRALDAASGSLVGIGLFGTFLGLTLGLHNFDSNTSESIQNSIQTLLDGMKTAFGTSLAGMFASLLFTFFDKPIRNRYANALRTLTDKLDSMYYIDDTELLNRSLQDESSTLRNEITSLRKMITYVNEDGYEVTMGNAIRELLINSHQQTKTLSSFDTDLSTALNNVLGDTMSSKFKELLLPQMDIMIKHIDQMADTVVKPSNDLMTTVATELRDTMVRVVEEFKQRVEETTARHLDTLSQSLDSATLVMDSLPENVNNATASLQKVIHQMQESMSKLTEDVISKQSDLLALQESMTEGTQAMLTALTDEVGNLERAGQENVAALEQLKRVHGHIAESTESLLTVSDNMKEATSAFQEERITVSAVRGLVEDSGKMSDKYVSQFEVIKNGLSSIFGQLQDGLEEYRNTVGQTTNTLMEEYSKAHNDAVESLKSSVEALTDLVEELHETIQESKE